MFTKNGQGYPLVKRQRARFDFYAGRARRRAPARDQWGQTCNYELLQSPHVKFFRRASIVTRYSLKGGKGLVDRIHPVFTGIDHAFSFPLRYFETHHILPDWPTFLDDFQKHW